LKKKPTEEPAPVAQKKSEPQIEQMQKVTPLQDPIIEVPPVADHRLFNENDILGELDRDSQGNLVLPSTADSSGSATD